MLMALAAAAPLPAAAQTAEGAGALTIEQRLQRVEDELAIRRVLVDYSATQDSRDFAAYAALFAEDGEWVNGATVYKGREAIMDMLVGLYGETPPGYVNAESYHISSNPQIELDGDRATARSRHLLVMRGEGGAPTPMLAGLYEDEFIRENGEWKILRRVDTPVMPTREEWLVFVRARQAENAAE
jgi:ketosteroid isomerase-like protein